MKNGRKCGNYNIGVHTASFLNQLGSKKHFENIKQVDLNIPSRLIQINREKL